jgi:hypothetical protein
MTKMRSHQAFEEGNSLPGQIRSMRMSSRAITDNREIMNPSCNQNSTYLNRLFKSKHHSFRLLERIDEARIQLWVAFPEAFWEGASHKRPLLPRIMPKMVGYEKNKGMNWGLFALLEEKSGRCPEDYQNTELSIKLYYSESLMNLI